MRKRQTEHISALLLEIADRMTSIRVEMFAERHSVLPERVEEIAKALGFQVFERAGASWIQTRLAGKPPRRTVELPGEKIEEYRRAS